MPKTKFTRIAVEGATVDGRTIDAAWIDQMAAGYNPATYTARVNCEHIRGFSPEPPFNAYGSVLALKAEDVTLQIDGKPKNLRALYAEIDANDQLVAANGKGQKLYTSCEIAPNFANTGKAGLVGLAITDNPASLGTEMLQFAASASVNPLAARKQDPANHFSAAAETNIEYAGVAPATDSETTSALKSIAAFFTGLSKKDGPVTPPPPPPPAEKPEAANDNFSQFAAQMGALVGTVEKISGTVDGFGARFNAIEKAQDELKKDVESTDRSNFSRPPSTGPAGGQYDGIF